VLIGAVSTAACADADDGECGQHAERPCGVVIRSLEKPFEFVKTPAHLGNRQMLGRKSQMRVGLVDFVLEHWFFFLLERA